jgi:hypothetical protein
MKESVREYDIVCRFGGEEFAILLPETTLSQAYERAELIRNMVKNIEFTVPTSVTPIRVTMSFGIAQRENFSQTPDEIIHNADLALYHSKLSGRNRSFAYVNDSYLDFSTASSEAQTPPNSAHQPQEKKTEASLPASQPILPFQTHAPETRSAEHPATSEEAGTQKKNSRPQSSKFMVGFFISLLAMAATLSFAGILQWMPLISDRPSFDWFGLIVLSVLVAVSEGFSVDLSMYGKARCRPPRFPFWSLI